MKTSKPDAVSSLLRASIATTQHCAPNSRLISRINSGRFTAAVLTDTLSAPEPSWAGISMALQQILFRSHEESRRFVLVAYLGEYSETPTNLLSFCLHCELMSVFSLLTSIPRFSIVSNFSSCS